MGTINLVISCRIEELPTLCGFTGTSLARDLADMQAYKPSKYTTAFMKALADKCAAVSAVVFPKKLTAELALITARIITNELALRQMLNLLDGYLREAKDLTIDKKKFGIKEVRAKISNDDQEGLNSALLFLEGNIADNMVALTAADYTVAQQTALVTLHGQLNTDNIAQNAKLQERALLVVDNMGVLNDLATTLQGIWADGKSLYKLTDKTRLKDYTLTKLIAQIRQEELRTLIAGILTDVNNVLVNKGKLVAKKVTGGRTRTVYSDKKGYYELKGLEPGIYNITVSLGSVVVMAVQAEAVTKEKVTKDIKLPVAGRVISS